MKYWLSGPRFTVRVIVIDNRITWTAPVFRRFIGQPLIRLVQWMQADRIINQGEA